MAVPLLALLANTIRAGLTALRTKIAKAWFKKLVKQVIVKKTLNKFRSPGKILARNNKTSFWRKGSMYFFVYDAKHKDTLPYWDAFPLVIPIERYRDGFLGINFHYLYPKDRAILLDQLQVFANNDKLDETTRLRMTYRSLGNFTKLKRAKPCIHRYLDSHMGSTMVPVNADEWGTALFLPVERFKGRNKTAVWMDSKAKMLTY